MQRPNQNIKSNNLQILGRENLMLCCKLGPLASGSGKKHPHLSNCLGLCALSGSQPRLLTMEAEPELIELYKVSFSDLRLSFHSPRLLHRTAIDPDSNASPPKLWKASTPLALASSPSPTYHSPLPYTTLFCLSLSISRFSIQRIGPRSSMHAFHPSFLVRWYFYKQN
jgi:hypothetical protein